MTMLIEAETWDETWDRFKDAGLWLFTGRPLRISRQGKPRGKIGYFFHTGMNILTEAARRNAEAAAKTILFGFPALILLYEWGNDIVAKVLP